MRRNQHIEILPLSTGCLGQCTYCKTRHARGHLGSYDPDVLVARLEAAVRDPQVGGCTRRSGHLPARRSVDIMQ